MNTVRIICRQSRLSLLQAEIVKQRILAVQPATEVVITGRTSRGDRELGVPLWSLEGSDFFTEDIVASLRNGEADLAVHSMKDMSATHFFSHHAFAVADRDDVRDVVIFNEDIIERLKEGRNISVGTCSPRREEMAIGFLKKALPQTGILPEITTASIRGNVESRLRQLREGKFDATILATAGLNRLLRGPENSEVKSLLEGTRLMFLPLVECVPAPAQGAILVEADPANENACSLLQLINQPQHWEAAVREKRKGREFGSGCFQRFGVTTITTRDNAWTYAAGVDEKGRPFSEWDHLPQANVQHLFSSTDHMRSFFRYEWNEAQLAITTPAIFVANYKAVQHQSAAGLLNDKQIWAAGTRTWLELAAAGYWVTGSADALGFEQMLGAFNMPLINLKKEAVTILTHHTAAARWEKKGYQAVSNYRLVPTDDPTVIAAVRDADTLFWSSFSQFEFYGKYCRKDVHHLSCDGETAVLLRQAGIEPQVFPTIKSFLEWNRSTTRLHNAG